MKFQYSLLLLPIAMSQDDFLRRGKDFAIIDPPTEPITPTESATTDDNYKSNKVDSMGTYETGLCKLIDNAGLNVVLETLKESRCNFAKNMADTEFVLNDLAYVGQIISIILGDEDCTPLNAYLQSSIASLPAFTDHEQLKEGAGVLCPVPDSVAGAMVEERNLQLAIFLHTDGMLVYTATDDKDVDSDEKETTGSSNNGSRERLYNARAQQEKERPLVEQPDVNAKKEESTCDSNKDPSCICDKFGSCHLRNASTIRTTVTSTVVLGICFFVGSALALRL